jgi:hypothetical protein
MNFKGVQPFGKSPINALKFQLEVIIMTINLDGHTCMQKIGVSIQVLFWLGLEIKRI